MRAWILSRASCPICSAFSNRIADSAATRFTQDAIHSDLRCYLIILLQHAAFGMSGYNINFLLRMTLYSTFNKALVLRQLRLCIIGLQFVPGCGANCVIKSPKDPPSQTHGRDSCSITQRRG